MLSSLSHASVSHICLQMEREMSAFGLFIKSFFFEILKRFFGWIAKNSHLFSYARSVKSFELLPKNAAPSDVATCVCTQMFIYKIIPALGWDSLYVATVNISEMIQHGRGGLHGDICLKSRWCASAKQKLLHKFNDFMCFKISAISLSAATHRHRH